jgi:hypothetical protein
MNIFSIGAFPNLLILMLLGWFSSSCNDLQAPTPPPPAKRVLPTKPLLIKERGSFAYEFEAANALIRFKKDGAILTRKDFLRELAHKKNQDLHYLITHSIAEYKVKNYNSIKLKSPPLSKAYENLDFFWLFQEQKFSNDNIQDSYKDYLVHCIPALSSGKKDSKDYKERFLGIVDGLGETHWKKDLDAQGFSNASVFFINLGSPPDRLVIPCPINANFQSPRNANLLNLSLYAQLLLNSSNYERMASLWVALGAAVKEYFIHYPNDTIYLNSHGTGVHYLHLRIDKNNYDYHHVAEQIIKEPSGNNFYHAIFDSIEH